MIYAVSLNPAIDRYIYTDQLETNQTNTYQNTKDIFGGHAINSVKIIKYFIQDYILISKYAYKYTKFITIELNDINNKLFEQDNLRINYKIIHNSKTTEINYIPNESYCPATVEIFEYLNKRVKTNDHIIFSGALTNIEKDHIKTFKKTT
jgi:fructose-1-phosphate kinase PfkB-like protein